MESLIAIEERLREGECLSDIIPDHIEYHRVRRQLVGHGLPTTPTERRLRPRAQVIIGMWNGGMSQTEIAGKLKSSRQAVHATLKRAGDLLLRPLPRS